MSGEVIPNTWAYQGEWQWVRVSNNEPFLRPTYRVYIDVPPQVRIQKFDAQGSRITLMQNGEGSPFAGAAQILVIDTIAPASSGTISWTDGKSDKIQNMSLLVDFPRAKPSTWLDDSCLQEGIRLEPDSGNGAHLYLGATCNRSGEKLTVRLLWSDDVRHKSSSLPKVSTPSRTSVIFEFFPETDPSRKKDDDASFKFLGELNLTSARGATDGGKPFLYKVFWTPKAVRPRLSRSASLGLSYISYSEKPLNVSVTELGVTGKVQASYWLSPLVDVSANAFFTLVPLGLGTPQPAGISPLRVFGINGRVGYEFTPGKHPFGNFSLKLSGGWYTWGMLVPQAAYGVGFLMGPQILVSGTTRLANGKPLTGYFKFAPISDQAFSASLGNREVALGGSYQLNSALAAHPWFLTADFAQVAVDFAQAANQIRMSSFSLGASYGF